MSGVNWERDLRNVNGPTNAKEQAYRNCLAEAERIINRLLIMVLPVIGAAEHYTINHQIEAWKEQKENM